MSTPLGTAVYRDILVRHLVPMFPGARIEDAPVSFSVSGLASAETRTSLLVKPDQSWPHSFRLVRSTGFVDGDIRLVRQFVSAFRQTLVAADQPFFGFLVDRCTEDVVARSVRQALVDDELLPTIISLLKKWAIETYEGHPIVAAIGVDPQPEPALISQVHVGTLLGRNYAKVLSNGTDTLIVLSPSGHVVQHLSLEGASRAGVAVSHPFAPRAHLALAAWAKGGKVAFALNGRGEILVFRNKELKFAFRGGVWSHFGHSAMIERMGAVGDLTRAVYATCLDVSFSRTGACIAIARSAARARAFLSDTDVLASSSSDKSALLAHLIGGGFAAIPRAIREELAALDGALVLDRSGRIVAAGAIVRVPGGSDGGGRLAAAKALSRSGLAIKVSADGGITAFTHRGSDEEPEVAFQVCV